MKAFNVMEKTELEYKPINVEVMAHASMSLNLYEWDTAQSPCQQTLIVQRERELRGSRKNCEIITYTNN